MGKALIKLKINRMKFVNIALLAASASAMKIQDAEPTFQSSNKDILNDDFAHQGHEPMYAEKVQLLGLDGLSFYKNNALVALNAAPDWNQAPTPKPTENYCTNADKATGKDQDCSEKNNSAWNTHTSSKTGKPEKAMDAPYPDHPGSTYNPKGEVYEVAAQKK